MSSPETVKIYTIDQNGAPLAGVLVRVYDSTGATLITQQTSAMVSGAAVADFLLNGDDPAITYTIRMFKEGVAFDGSLGDMSKSPQSITVLSPPSQATPNSFDVKGETFTRPVATNPRLCRCSGFFLDISGRPLPNLTIRFINDFFPSVVDGNAIMSSEIQGQTDQDGYLELDLYRNGIYTAWVPGVEAEEDTEGTSAITFPRSVHVPDQNAANLPDLLFPVVVSVDFGVPSVTIDRLQSTQLSPVVMASDGRTLIGAAQDDVLYTVDDPNIAGVSVGAVQVTLVGVNPGTTLLRAVRRDLSVVKIPAAAITGQPIRVTVS